jgi:hypothetical protein
LGSDLLEEEAIPPSPLSGGGGGGKNGASTGSKTDTPEASTVSEHSKAGGCSPSARSARAGGGGVGPFGARVRPVLPVETGRRLNTTPSTTSDHSSTAGAAMISTRLVAPPARSSAFSVAIAESTESAWSFICGSRSTSCAVPRAAKRLPILRGHIARHVEQFGPVADQSGGRVIADANLFTNASDGHTGDVHCGDRLRLVLWDCHAS